MKLEVKNLTKCFGETEVLHGITFGVESGKALGLLGRNGAGKTTTIRIIMGLFEPNSGEVLLDGKPFQPRKVHIGYLPEERGLYPKKKIIDQLIYLGELRGLSKNVAKKNADKWLERLEVAQYRDKKLDTLSKGNQQKVQLASTFLCDPDIVILDEPFSGLDPVNAQVLKDVISEQIEANKLVIFSSHQMSYVEEFCEDIALVNSGDIVLTGNLKAIKKEYGRDRFVLKSEQMMPSDVANYLQVHLGDLVEKTDVKKQETVLLLKNPEMCHDFLQRLGNLRFDVECFAKYHPSLADIFIERVGDHHEGI